MKAVGTTVILKLNPRRESSSGGIALPIMAIRPESEGTVIAIGNKVTHVSEGQVVGFPSHLGTRFEARGHDWLSIDESKLLYVRE